MTLLYVIILDIGIVLIVSAFENKPLRETFSDILNGNITPATSSTGTVPPVTGGSVAPSASGAIAPTSSGAPLPIRRL